MEEEIPKSPILFLSKTVMGQQSNLLYPKIRNKEFSIFTHETGSNVIY